MKLFDVYPLNDITITKAKGSNVWDDSGKKYLDMYGGHAVISIGHSHPHYVKGLKKQLDKVGFYSNSINIPLQQEFANLLEEASGKKGFQLFLCNSGAEANENALKTASFYNGRKKVIAFSKAFHGRTSLAVAVTDNPGIVAPVNQTENVVLLPFNDINALENYFKENGNDICAVIVEGIQGVGGIRIASDEFLLAIRKFCDQYNSIFIADSVQCGYGRSGKFFSTDYSGVEADIYSMAKGIGNGFPLAAILISPKIHAKHFMLGTTFGGNHLACSAGIAVLEVMKKENLVHNAEKIGKYLMDELKNIPELENVRGRGLMIGFDVPERFKDLKKNLLWKHRIFTGEAKPNVIRLLPSLALTKKQADQFIKAVKKEIKSIKKDVEIYKVA